MRAFKAALIFVLLASPAAAGDLDALADDGWYSWQAAASADARFQCCSVRGCCDQLISRAPRDEVRIYARLESGEVTKIRAVNPNCELDTQPTFTDLGHVDTDESLDWLEARVVTGSRTANSAVFAIAMHEGERPYRFLLSTARTGGDPDVRQRAVFGLSRLSERQAYSGLREIVEDRQLDMETRGRALFWLAQSDSDLAFDYLDRLISSR